MHWTGSPNAILGNVNIDGEELRFMGSGTAPAMRQIFFDMSAMVTDYVFESDKIRLSVSFFSTLFTDDLYLKIARHANEMAYQVREIFVSNGYSMLFESDTNQQYPIMSDEELAIIGQNFGYEYWTRVDETHSGVRFCSSWATTQENVDALREAVAALKK